MDIEVNNQQNSLNNTNFIAQNQIPQDFAYQLSDNDYVPINNGYQQYNQQGQVINNSHFNYLLQQNNQQRNCQQQFNQNYSDDNYSSGSLNEYELTDNYYPIDYTQQYSGTNFSNLQSQSSSNSFQNGKNNIQYSDNTIYQSQSHLKSENKSNNSQQDQNKTLKQAQFQIMPLLKNLRQKELYFIFNEVLIDLDQIFDDNLLDKNLGHNRFKKVINVKQRQENEYYEIVFETNQKTMRDFKFLIDRVKTLPQQQALQLSQLLEQYQMLVDKQISEEDIIRQKYSESLLLERHEFCQQKSEQFISNLDQNANVFYYQVKIDPKTFETVNFKQGYSRKLAWIFGCSPEVLSQLYTRYGIIDFGDCASKIEMSMSKVFQSFSAMQKERYMRENKIEGEKQLIDEQYVVKINLQTLDGFSVPDTIIVSKINLSQEFDEKHGIVGLMPEYILICNGEVDMKYIQMLIQHRCETNFNEEQIVQSYLKMNNLNENYDHYIKSKNFIEKYYSDEYSNELQTLKSKHKNNSSNPFLPSKKKQRCDETLDQLYKIVTQAK